MGIFYILLGLFSNGLVKWVLTNSIRHLQFKFVSKYSVIYC